MSSEKSSILVVSDDAALRDRISGVLERELDVHHVPCSLQANLEDTASQHNCIAAVLDLGADDSTEVAEVDRVPAGLPLLVLRESSDADDLVAACRIGAECLHRQAPDEHIVHALRLSVVRMQSAGSGAQSQATKRPSATEIATQSVLGSLRSGFSSDLAHVLRDCEFALQAHRNDDNPPSFERLVERVRTLRKLSDTLDLAEFAPLMFALEVTLRDLPTEEGRVRIRDLLRQLRNIASGRPASAGFDGRRIRVSLIGSTPQEVGALGLQDPDRLDIRPVRDLRMFARQSEIYKPDVIVVRVAENDLSDCLSALRELRGGTSELVVLLTDKDRAIDPVQTLRFPRFAAFTEPFDWHAIAGRIFETEGESERRSTILIIHDDATVIRDIEHYLDPDSFVIQAVKSASDVIEEVRRRGPDLIFLAARLERMSGFDVCREIRSQMPLARVPIVMVSERFGREDREQAFRVGASDYLQVPFLEHELRHRADILLEYRRLQYQATAQDPLTGLRDACTLVDLLEEELARARQADEALSFLALSIDRYGMIRDVYGASAADLIARSLADVLRKVFDSEDLVFRGTRDEFFVIRKNSLEDIERRNEVFQSISDIRKLTSRSEDGRGFYATVTGGHIVIPPGTQDAASCVRRTLRVLNASKKMQHGKIMTAEIDPNF